MIDVAWGLSTPETLYPVDVFVQAHDRQGLLRDITEVFAREKINVTAAQTQTIKGVAWMTLTVEVNDSARLNKVLGLVASLKGVVGVKRK